MHDDQLEIGVDRGSTLLGSQFPELAALPLAPVGGLGTVNAVFRVGSRLAARFPLRPRHIDEASAALRAEADAAAELGEVCPYPVPQLVAIGDPGLGYPMPWSIWTWVQGVDAAHQDPGDSHDFALDLAHLVAAMRRAQTRGRRFTGPGRGGLLRDHDDWMATCCRNSHRLVDVPRVQQLWLSLHGLPRASHDVMSHTDLVPGNVLVHRSRIAGVLDAGGFGPADPALDLVGAWHLLRAGPRSTFRAALDGHDQDVDDRDVDHQDVEEEWDRGRAWALEQAMGLVWYYETSNPTLSDIGRRTVARLLDDDAGGYS